MNGNLTAFVNAGIYPHVIIGRGHAHMHKCAGGGQEIIVRVFGIQSDFEGMTVNGQFFLCLGQLFTVSNTQLPFDKVFAGDHLGHWMFDLKACVHFHEIERTRRI